MGKYGLIYVVRREQITICLKKSAFCRNCEKVSSWQLLQVQIGRIIQTKDRLSMTNGPLYNEKICAYSFYSPAASTSSRILS